MPSESIAINFIRYEYIFINSELNSMERKVISEVKRMG